jgi:integrase
VRGSGRVFQRAGSAHYWISYYCRGKEHRESSRSPDRARAERLLKHRLREVGADHLGAKPFVGPADARVLFEVLVQTYLQDYEVRGLRSASTAAIRAKHLGAAFGGDRAVSITPARLRAYQAARLEAGADPATVNRELSALHRMFRLAVETGLLSTTPQFPAGLDESAPRQGFFEHAEYLAVRAALPPDYQDVLDFGYHCGWRKKEITQLSWAEVDLPGGVVRLDPARSKSKTGRLLPLSPPLRAVLSRRLLARRLDTPLVFHRAGGRPVSDWRKTWWRATRAAGLPGKLFHDLRRTVARNLVRSGVPERVAMAIIGHKTRSMLDRYNIVSEHDLRSATQRLADYVSASPATSTVIPFPMAAAGSSR